MDTCPTCHHPGNELVEAINTVEDLRRGDCWCEIAIGNPMQTSHSAACLRAQALLKNVTGQDPLLRRF